jgi:Tfp pilus assembly protein PilO
VISPKRQKASELNDQIDQLHASISQQQQVASFAEQARKDFPRYYGRLVVLGKAVPQQADTGSMLVQLNTVAGENHVDFRSIDLGTDAASAGTGTSATSTPTASAASNSTAPAGTATTPSTGTTGSTGSTTGTASTATAAAAPVPATESSAAALPIGATVGPAGLGILPYTLKFNGGFFDISSFIGGVDNLVQPTSSGVRVTPDGRLFTVDGFSITGGLAGPTPKLKADFAVTAYSTPSNEGLTLGASPSGPAPSVPGVAPTQPASAVVAK